MLVVHSVQTPQSRTQPAPVVLLLGEFFFDNILQHFVFQAQIRIHLLQATVLLFQLLHAFYFTDAHPAILRFPLVKRGFAEPMLAAQIFYHYSSFRFLQNVHDLAF